MGTILHALFCVSADKASRRYKSWAKCHFGSLADNIGQIGSFPKTKEAVTYSTVEFCSS